MVPTFGRWRPGAYARGLPSRQLSDYLADWFDRERHGWATSTRRQRHGVLDLWIDPYLPSGARLDRFAEKAVSDWLGVILAAGASATQAKAAVSILSSALGTAHRDGLIERNPCVGLRVPAPMVSRPRYLTPLQVERLKAEMPSPRDALLVSVLFYAGLRLGEALGPSWDSVDLAAGRLVVEQSYVLGAVKGTKTGWIRWVDLCKPLRDDLAEA